MPVRTLVPPEPYDLRRSLRSTGATFMVADGSFWYASHTAAGAATIAVSRVGARLEVEAWGPGSSELLDSTPRLLGLDDRPDDFDPGSGILRDIHRRRRGLHLGSTGRIYESIVPTVIGQRVTTKEASASRRALLHAYGVPAPGPVGGLRILPPASALADVGYEDLHRLGIERERAVVVIECARRAKRLEEALRMPPVAARDRLRAVRGVGPWTAETVMGVAYGDRDAVPPGDYNLPNTVASVLAGEPRADDPRMFELLEPFRPMRRRAIVLIKESGIHAPRFGPRRATRGHVRLGP